LMIKNLLRGRFTERETQYDGVVQLEIFSEPRTKFGLIC
jgi:hypothetical protein